jgi:hypothetical protein
MRLSEWRARGKSRDATAAKVWATVDPILTGLGAEPDPHAWVAWGDDPAIRFTVYVPTAAGMISCFVRVNISGEGPRATAKLLRWSRVQIGELSLETQAGHRLLTFQLEQQVIRAVDGEADLAAAFALDLFAAMDGRPAPVQARGRRRAAPVKRAAANPSRSRATAPPKPATSPPKTAAPRPAAGKLERAAQPVPAPTASGPAERRRTDRRQQASR